MKIEDYNRTPKPSDDAEKILAAYAQLPDEKKPILLAVLNGLISGMEIQEMLSAGKESA